MSVTCSSMKGFAIDYILEQNLDFGGCMFGLLWARRLVHLVTVKKFHIYKNSMERTLRLLRFLFSSLTQGILLFEPEKRGNEQRNQLSYEIVFFLVGGE